MTADEFTMIGAHTTRSSRGYTVTIVLDEGRDKTFRYEEDCGRVMDIYGEMLGLNVGAFFGLYLTETPWLPPHEREPITEAQRREIGERLIAACAFMRCPIDVT